MPQKNEAGNTLPLEYDAIRQEYLALVGQIHSLFTSGFVVLGVIAGGIAIAVFGEPYNALLKFATEYPAFVPVAVVFLSLLGFGFAIGIALNICGIEFALDRMLAYLAVFRDAGIRSLDDRGYGWHIWTRIEKAADGAQAFVQPINFFQILSRIFDFGSATSPKRIFYAQDRLFNYLGLLASFYGVLIFATFVLGKDLCLLMWIVVAGSVFLGLVVYSLFLAELRRRSQANQLGWIRRWICVARLSQQDIDAIFTSWNPLSEQPRDNAV